MDIDPTPGLAHSHNHNRHLHYGQQQSQQQQQQQQQQHFHAGHDYNPLVPLQHQQYDLNGYPLVATSDSPATNQHNHHHRQGSVGTEVPFFLDQRSSLNVSPATSASSPSNSSSSKHNKRNNTAATTTSTPSHSSSSSSSSGGGGGGINALSAATMTTQSASIRKASISQSHNKRNKSARSHPYSLRDSSNSISSVASSSNTSHNANDSLHDDNHSNSSSTGNASSAYYSASSSNAASAPSYSDLGLGLSSEMSFSNSVPNMGMANHQSHHHHHYGDPSAAPIQQVDGIWNASNYIHSRSSSISSVGSEFSSSSANSSGWSDILDGSNSSEHHHHQSNAQMLASVGVATGPGAIMGMGMTLNALDGSTCSPNPDPHVAAAAAAAAAYYAGSNTNNDMSGRNAFGRPNQLQFPVDELAAMHANNGTTSLAFLDGGLHQHHNQSSHGHGQHNSQDFIGYDHGHDLRSITGHPGLPIDYLSNGQIPSVLQYPPLIHQSSSSSLNNDHGSTTSSPVELGLHQQNLQIMQTHHNYAGGGMMMDDGSVGGFYTGPIGIDPATAVSSSGLNENGLDVMLVNLAEAIKVAGASNTTTEKAKINFVHGWLNSSFVMHPEGNVSRHALYNSYIHICHLYQLPPINAASYGKAVRSCWPGIKTRRLGVRGASRYHYCGIKPATEQMRLIVDYYNSFEPITGKPISCYLPGMSVDTSDGMGMGARGSIDGSSAEYGSDEREDAQDGLVGSLTGLGFGRDRADSSASQHPPPYHHHQQQQQQQEQQPPRQQSQSGDNNGNKNNNELAPMTLLPPGVSPTKMEGILGSGTGTGSPSDAATEFGNTQCRPSSAYSDTSPSAASTKSFNDLHDHHQQQHDSQTEDYAYGPFDSSSKSLRRQISAPTSLHEQNLAHNDSGEISFADLKTPTAFHFLTTSASTSTTPASASAASSNTPPAAKMSILDADSSLGTSVEVAQSAHIVDKVTPVSQPGLLQPEMVASHLERRRASSPGSTSSSSSEGRNTIHCGSNSGASRLRGRRATLPDLHITVPPLKRGPPSASTEAGPSKKPSFQTDRVIQEEKEEAMEDGDLGEGNNREDTSGTKDDEGAGESMTQYDGTQTAKLIPGRRVIHDTDLQRGLSVPSRDDLPLPSFEEIVHNFSAKLVISAKDSPASMMFVQSPGQDEQGEMNDSNSIITTEGISVNAVVAARNRSLAMLKNLDTANAEAIWELYKTSHCRGLLRLAQQGRLEEFEGGLLLFWAQLDATQQVLVQHPILSDAMYQADALLYSVLLSQLCDRVLGTSTPSEEDKEAIQPIHLLHLQHIADNIENWALTALNPFPREFVDCRVELASRVGHLLARLVGVAQLAQALAGVLHQDHTPQDVVHTWEGLDFEMIIDQCALVTSCSQDSLQAYLDNFHRTLQNAQAELESAPEKTSGIREFVHFAEASLKRYVLSKASGDTSTERQSQSTGTVLQLHSSTQSDTYSPRVDERSFLLKWSYLSGQVLRELTIKSSPSFGSYQIMSLFIEEYLAFKILKNITLHGNVITASVEAETINSASALRGIRNDAVMAADGNKEDDLSSIMRIIQQQENAARAFLVSPQIAHQEGKSATNSAGNSSGGSQGQSPFAMLYSSPVATAPTSSSSQARGIQDNDVSNTSSPHSGSTGSSAFRPGLPRSHSLLPTSASQENTMSSFVFPPGQPSASAFNTSFNFSSALSPTTRAIFGEKTPIYLAFGQGSTILPPPTPSAFSSFPDLRSPGLSRYFASSTPSGNVGLNGNDADLLNSIQADLGSSETRERQISSDTLIS